MKKKSPKAKQSYLPQLAILAFLVLVVGGFYLCGHLRSQEKPEIASDTSVKLPRCNPGSGPCWVDTDAGVIGYGIIKGYYLNYTATGEDQKISSCKGFKVETSDRDTLANIKNLKILAMPLKNQDIIPLTGFYPEMGIENLSAAQLDIIYSSTPEQPIWLKVFQPTIVGRGFTDRSGCGLNEFHILNVSPI